MFVCHGNICRSPMAEFVFKDILKREGRESDFFVASSATSCEEIGNSVHHGTVKSWRNTVSVVLGSAPLDCAKTIMIITIYL